MTERPPLLLLSKLAAGGLSAGVVLVWWPVLPHSSGAGSWVLRGIIWTCLFELLVLALEPLERSLLGSRAWIGLREKLGVGPLVGHRGAVALGLVMLLACAGLVWRGPEPSPARPQKPRVEVRKIIQPVKVVKETQVIERAVPSKPKIIVKKQTVQVIKKVPVAPKETPTPKPPSEPKTPSTPSKPSSTKAPAKVKSTKTPTAKQ